MTNSETLARCRFCGSDNLKSGGDDKIVGTWCLNCGATGPNQYSNAATWNTRTFTQEDVERVALAMHRAMSESFNAADDPLKWEGIALDEQAKAALEALGKVE